MLAFLKLIRLPNLLIIALTQYMVRLCLLEPIADRSNMYLQMSDLEFAMLVIGTVLVAAAGYVINDYFDVQIDNINKPEEMVIDHGVKRRVAMGAHAVMSFIGVAMGVYLSWRCNILMSGSTLFIGSVIGLWFYSTSFKYQFLTGNLLISLFTGMVPFMVALFEVPRLIQKYPIRLLEQQQFFGEAATDTMLIWAGSYAVAAFGLSMIREMIKDMEDVEGDKQYGCRTAPIVLGIQKTKWIVATLLLFFMAMIGYVQQIQLNAHDKNSFLYFLALIQLPSLYILIRTLTAKEKTHFHKASMGIKLIMLSGVCYLLYLKFMLMK